MTMTKGNAREVMCLFQKARQHLCYGENWTQDTNEDDDGKKCLGGSLNWAANGDASDMTGTIDARCVLEDLADDSIEDFNDDDDRTASEVLELLDRGIRAADDVLSGVK